VEGGRRRGSPAPRPASYRLIFFSRKGYRQLFK
jgi:hypothetical protein